MTFKYFKRKKPRDIQFKEQFGFNEQEDYKEHHMYDFGMEEVIDYFDPEDFDNDDKKK